MVAMIRDLKALHAGLNVVRLFPSYVSSFVIMSLKNLTNPQPDSTKSKLVFIMSFPRSGTTALGSLLKQPETGFSYYGEFFAFNQWSKINQFTPLRFSLYCPGFVGCLVCIGC